MKLAGRLLGVHIPGDVGYVKPGLGTEGSMLITCTRILGMLVCIRLYREKQIRSISLEYSLTVV